MLVHVAQSLHPKVPFTHHRVVSKHRIVAEIKLLRMKTVVEGIRRDAADKIAVDVRSRIEMLR